MTFSKELRRYRNGVKWSIQDRPTTKNQYGDELNKTNDTHRSMVMPWEVPGHLIVERLKIVQAKQRWCVPENRITKVKKMGTSRDATKALGAIAASI